MYSWKLNPLNLSEGLISDKDLNIVARVFETDYVHHSNPKKAMEREAEFITFKLNR